MPNNAWIYQFLDIFFFGFHSCIIVFNLIGWIWRKTRIVHLSLIALTALSWSVLGIWYGFGYCPCTDWHWRVRKILGYRDMSSSYIQFLIKNLTGLDIANKTVDTVVVISLVIILFLSIGLFGVDILRKRRTRYKIREFDCFAAQDREE